MRINLINQKMNHQATLTSYSQKSKKSSYLLELLASLTLFFTSNVAFADTIKIGQNGDYSSLSEAESSLSDGDTVLIQPGTYKECAVLDADNLTIKPMGWTGKGSDKRVKFTNVTCQGKGIFVVRGNNTTVEGIDFVNARVPDKNGAGIRLEGKTLTLKGTAFINNENGILTNYDGQEGSVVKIQNSYFQGNGKCDPDCAHGIYIGKIDQLIVENSVFEGQKSGHHIKSRALSTNVIGNTITDGTNGTASYLIDIPNGGNVLIENNKLLKGPKAENTGTAICIACEGESNRGNTIIIRNNDFNNKVGKSVVFINNQSGIAAEVNNNKFKGNKVVKIQGTAL